MSHPWPPSENLPDEPVDALGVDGPFQGDWHEEPPASSGARPHDPPDGPSPTAAELEER